MKYRIENVNIPESAGVAGPRDEYRELEGRRIVAVLGETDPDTIGVGSMRLRVLTEVIEEESLVAGLA